MKRLFVLLPALVIMLAMFPVQSKSAEASPVEMASAAGESTTLKENCITAEDIYAECNYYDQDNIKVSASQLGTGVLTYTSDNENISVDEEGNVIIAKDYSGISHITIIAASDGIYTGAEKTITVTVSKQESSMSVHNIETDYSEEDQQFYRPINDYYGSWIFSYSCTSSDITVSEDGWITIKGGFVGEAELTIRQEEDTYYKAIEKTVRIIVHPINRETHTYDKVLYYSPKNQTFPVEFDFTGTGTPVYSTNSTAVTVNKNRIGTVKGGFVGDVVIHIYIPAEGIYAESNLYINIHVYPKYGSVTAKNTVRTYSAKAQSFNIGAKRLGTGKLTYTSNNKNITVNSTGKVTVKAKYIGQASITIKAAACKQYYEAVKIITVKVNPSKTSLVSLKNPVKGKLIMTWKKNTVGSGYQVQYSTNSKFTGSVKLKNVAKNTTTKLTISSLTKGKIYYVRIRTFKKVGQKTYYSGWSTAKKLKLTK